MKILRTPWLYLSCLVVLAAQPFIWQQVGASPEAGLPDALEIAGVVELVEYSEREHYYSPFMITAPDGTVFKTITFTDVGLRQPEPGPVDPLLLETIAESLAQKIAHHEQLNFTPVVAYDKALIDPDNHLFCEQHHLYIALWRGYAPDRWGYSLWSGCNEEHQFAWKEVVASAGDAPDLVSAVDPLTTSIAETLAEATRKSCFLAAC
jgi:hypothetical protein